MGHSQGPSQVRRQFAISRGQYRNRWMPHLLCSNWMSHLLCSNWMSHLLCSNWMSRLLCSNWMSHLLCSNWMSHLLCSNWMSRLLCSNWMSHLLWSMVALFTVDPLAVENLVTPFKVFKKQKQKILDSLGTFGSQLCLPLSALICQ